MKFFQLQINVQVCLFSPETRHTAQKMHITLTFYSHFDLLRFRNKDYFSIAVNENNFNKAIPKTNRGAITVYQKSDMGFFIASKMIFDGLSFLVLL